MISQFAIGFYSAIAVRSSQRVLSSRSHLQCVRRVRKDSLRAHSGSEKIQAQHLQASTTSTPCLRRSPSQSCLPQTVQFNKDFKEACPAHKMLQAVGGANR